MTVYADDLILGGTASRSSFFTQYDGAYSDDIIYMPPFLEVGFPSAEATGSGALIGGAVLSSDTDYVITDSGTGADLVPQSSVTGTGSYIAPRVGAGALIGIPVISGSGTFAENIPAGTGDLSPVSAMSGAGTFEAFVVAGSGNLIGGAVISGVGSFLVPSGLPSVVISYESYTSEIPVVDVGDVITIEARYTDVVTGIPVDPLNLLFKQRTPSNVITTSTPTRVFTGFYTVDVTVTERGKWRFRFEADGIAVEGQITANYSMVH